MRVWLRIHYWNTPDSKIREANMGLAEMWFYLYMEMFNCNLTWF